MIDHIAVTNSRQERLVMPLKNPLDSNFNVMSIDGLGPVKGDINTTDISSRDGSLYNSSRVGVRNITLTLGFVDNPSKGLSVEDVRLKSYQYFRVKDQITFEVVTDNRHVRIDGYVESNEPDIFSNTEGCEISIICPDPYFYEVYNDSSNVVDFSSRVGGFEFPFHNDLPGTHLEFSRLMVNTVSHVNYRGDFPIGIRMSIYATGDTSGITLARRNPDQNMKLDLSLKEGDLLTVDTRLGKKSVTLLRDGSEINMIHTLGIRPSWISLYPGDNEMAYSATSGIENAYVYVTYYTAYMGV